MRMGTKPCLKLGSLLLTGLLLAGCDSTQRNGNSIARNNQTAPTPTFPSGSTGTYGASTPSAGFNNSSSGANIYRGPTSGTPSYGSTPAQSSGFSNQGFAPTAQPTGFASPSSAPSGFGGTPSPNAFPATPTSGTNSFGSSSPPPVGAGGPGLPSSTAYPGPSTPAPFSPPR
jgi:hypothetical protein